MGQIKQAFKSRTVRYAAALACLSVLQGYVAYLPTKPAIQAVIGCGIAVGIVVLRYMTTQPVSEK